jgi:hypothetical protein
MEGNIFVGLKFVCGSFSECIFSPSSEQWIMEWTKSRIMEWQKSTNLFSERDQIVSERFFIFDACMKTIQ